MERLMREIMNFDDEFRQEEAAGSVASPVQY